jgi:hypothetical protein
LVIEIEPGYLLDIAHGARDEDTGGVFDAFVAGVVFGDRT